MSIIMPVLANMDLRRFKPPFFGGCLEGKPKENQPLREVVQS